MAPISKHRVEVRVLFVRLKLDMERWEKAGASLSIINCAERWSVDQGPLRVGTINNRDRSRGTPNQKLRAREAQKYPARFGTYQNRERDLPQDLFRSEMLP